MALTEERFIELMALMTEKQNKILEDKLVTKLDEVKAEMTGAIDTIAQRQDVVEKEQQNLKEQFDDIKEQLVEIKKAAEGTQVDSNVRSYAEILQSCGGGSVEDSKGIQSMFHEGSDKEAENQRVEDIITFLGELSASILLLKVTWILNLKEVLRTRMRLRSGLSRLSSDMK